MLIMNQHACFVCHWSHDFHVNNTSSVVQITHIFTQIFANVS